MTEKTNGDSLLERGRGGAGPDLKMTDLLGGGPSTGLSLLGLARLELVHCRKTMGQ